MLVSVIPLASVLLTVTVNVTGCPAATVEALTVFDTDGPALPHVLFIDVKITPTALA